MAIDMKLHTLKLGLKKISRIEMLGWFRAQHILASVVGKDIIWIFQPKMIGQ